MKILPTGEYVKLNPEVVNKINSMFSTDVSI